MVLGWGGADAGVTEFLHPIVDRQHGYGGDFRVRRQKGLRVHHRAERDIPEIGRCIMIANHSIRQQGKGRRTGESKPTVSLDTKAAAPVGMIDKR